MARKEISQSQGLAPAGSSLSFVYCLSIFGSLLPTGESRDKHLLPSNANEGCEEQQGTGPPEGQPRKSPWHGLLGSLSDGLTYQREA